ncbi:MAG: retropepsin-like aspartic protease [Gemmatimonadaceae bacterium]
MAVGDSARQYVFDTGANLSTMMRSEANALGLRILRAGIDVGTSSALRVTADLAVAPSLTIGSMTFRNVVFLVLDDAMLTFGDHTIPGIVGFPVVNQMREVQLIGGQEVFVPAEAPRRPQANLSLSGLTPLIRVIWRNHPLLCRLDTGANTTDFYEPFFRRFQAFIDSTGTSLSRRVGSAGGISEVQVRKLTDVRLMLGDTVALADSVDVLVRPITRTAADNYLDCNIGTDILGTFDRLILNFSDMAFVLR